MPYRARPIQPLLYRFALPAANHVFLPGHRIHHAPGHASFIELPLVTPP